VKLASQQQETSRAPATLDVSPDGERRLFWWLRKQMLGRQLAFHLAASRLRILVVGLLTCIFWGGMFWVFREGFHVLDAAIAHEATRAQTIHAVYNVFFLSLLVMLTFSSAILTYGTLLDSEEVAYLLTTPTRGARIVLHKFQETLVFSCWGFILLGSPLLIAYGVQAAAPWYYYVLLGPFMVSFVFIPAGCGSLACLLLVYLLPRLRLQLVVAAGALLLAVGGYLGWSLLSLNQQDVMTPLWFQEVLARLRYTEQRLLPSWWLSSGLLEAAHPAGGTVNVRSWQESLGFLSVLVSNALWVPVVVAWAGGRLLRPCHSRLRGMGRGGRVTRASLIDTVAVAAMRPLPRPVHLLLLKDFRLFRRDPLQWSQFLIFFGLLALYFINVRRFHYGEPLDSWMTVIGFLNLGVVGLIHSTFTTRFIFPMISMEGRRSWILGTLPVRRELILWSKFIFACAVSIVPCATLILLSDLMLGIGRRTPVVVAIHQLVCWCLCLGISAIAVGLGARFPNLREPSPAKIAAGFGGTLNLVLSAAFIVTSVLLVAVPCYCWVQGRGAGIAGVGLGSSRAVVLGTLASVVLTGLVIAIPMRLGFRHFRRMEF
jgi:ABC-2 type transport system permease protein